MAEIHIGKLIKEVAKQRRISADELGKHINLTGQAVRNMYRKKDINTANLLKISKVLDYNFFKHLSEEVEEETQPLANEKQAVYEAKKEEIKSYSEQEFHLVLKLDQDLQKQIMELVFGQREKQAS